MSIRNTNRIRISTSDQEPDQDPGSCSTPQDQDKGQDHHLRSESGGPLIRTSDQDQDLIFRLGSRSESEP